ncbi:FUSC family protein, partial [Desulfovibrio sp. OttesenSCG-928-G11]|nr:FUSC family protein [Desulfovibrio sp. OttesenSCG-928-G11]
MALSRLFPLYVRYGIKMGVACFLSWAISYAIGSEYGLWAVVASIVAMQVNVAESFQQGVQRVIGTALGAALGVLLLLTVPPEPLLMGLAVFVVALGCGYLTRFSPISPITAIAAMVVFFIGGEHLGSGYMDAVRFGLMRVLEIAIGVGCAFVVALLLWPVRLVDTLRADLGLQFNESARLFDEILSAFIYDQRPMPYRALKTVESRIWDNHERLAKARRHESILYHYEHAVMKIQVTALDRSTESLRSMIEALNDYDEEGRDPLIGPELRELGDAVMAALRHLGGASPTTAAPDLVRGLTGGVGAVEMRLMELRRNKATAELNLHKLLQIFAFYQAARLLAES